MKYLLISIAALLMIQHTKAQSDSIPLPYEVASDTAWVGQERHYFSEIWDTDVVTNVSTPSLEIFRPEPGTNNGVGIIIAPGGALFGLSIENEGREVARWLNQRGYTAFVLKYRLVPTGEDGVQEISALWAEDVQKVLEPVARVLPYSIEDGLAAVAWVRERAATFAIERDKIGFMGFSAGGAVTMGVGYTGSDQQRPDFLAPIYPWTDAYAVRPAPENPQPIFIVCASDDGPEFVKGSVDLYSSWHKSGAIAALHMYSKGEHGFGMKKQNLPSDSWISRFHEWAELHVLSNSKKPNK
ncbi:Acetyl esterase/lipase [Robiginitalea myxolifaciens]|uniref:Acetyl esterase/lipase n=1 Tax=Robiginitalea myxolifaciens TaxID=400055 RepID=A0A1I6H7U9_9FLAO|nr:alpha/beta hydrolase [Robiginitalea myxolifaciens]SFR50522.1 Acetyl esterase/lipase [Robiginitalea myxolifaciens]